jgi:hypothetical protein
VERDKDRNASHGSERDESHDTARPVEPDGGTRRPAQHCTAKPLSATNVSFGRMNAPPPDDVMIRR